MRPWFALLLAAQACSPAGDDSATHGDWRDRPNAHARCFQVLERGAARRLIIFGAPDRSDTLAVISVGRDPEGSGTVHVPQEAALAVMSTTHLPFITALGRAGQLAGAAHIDRQRDSVILRAAADGRIVELASADGLDRERLLSSGARVVLDYPFGRSRVRSSLPGIVQVPVTEYLEEHPLGRAEWIRFFGVLLGAERTADSLFAAVAKRYGAAAVGLVPGKDPPKVLFGSAWQGQWHLPPGNSYMAQLISDAGGAYLVADRRATGNIAMDTEAVAALLLKADRFGTIIAHGRPLSSKELCPEERLALLPAVASGSFYLDSERSDIFGQALLEPDVLVAELACVLGTGTCPQARPTYVLRPGQ